MRSALNSAQSLAESRKKAATGAGMKEFSRPGEASIFQMLQAKPHIQLVSDFTQTVTVLAQTFVADREIVHECLLASSRMCTPRYVGIAWK
ncbi:hypothetical protein W97_07607 [Coniosporium apollinis CBS 100218]|uniref:Uncharacterized protein n=1 Tax=Coniosporium apollinis (strain CBS 100218) TaxID=1168221 RepID=R7Z2U6_CONA1|nr:uncharacterized protein W97_07607 [Coniosporium apollinis CBS 100218]EON68349.1 hypothetical protein W97_07607 [Coniosporium apollinis CBS 100218]